MRIFAVIFLFLCVGNTWAQVDQNLVSNLKTFAKAYGYVKYFHPSDEAADIDWKLFAAYGAEKVLHCKNSAHLNQTLQQLFEPLAPSIIFSDKEVEYDLFVITPKDTNGYIPTYWQHDGVSIGMINQNRGPYKSVRVNREKTIDQSSRFGNLSMSMDAEKYLGREIRFSGRVKMHDDSEGTGHLWLRIDNQDKSTCFFNNMNENPVDSADWARYEIIGEVCDKSAKLVFGTFMLGKGSVYVDDIQLEYKENDQWKDIPILNSDFENGKVGTPSDTSKWVSRGEGYSFGLELAEEGNNYAFITYEGLFTKEMGESIFDEFPAFGELIKKKIGDATYCNIPLNLYANESGTYPKSGSYNTFQEMLKQSDFKPTDVEFRLGNIINIYNVFQHFYPYHEEVEVDWDQELEKALLQSFQDTGLEDHINTIKQYTAPLKDGHIWISGSPGGRSVPPFSWEWIENRLVITSVDDVDLGLSVGDIVSSIDNTSSEAYFEEIDSQISAGTDGYRKYRAQTISLQGDQDTELTLRVNGEDIVVKRSKEYQYGKSNIEIHKWPYKMIGEDIYYLNLDIIEMDTITSLLDKLQEAKGIICDMRGYPKMNHGLISYLLPKKDTSTAWMQIQKTIYPDRNIIGYNRSGWEIEPQEPYLGDKKIVFIIDGRAISYAESYMSFIEGYNLATIIGQPTAGTNGNVNPFLLLGDIRVSWTGMKVVKHDGSQHHAIGILPDMFVEKTIEGVKARRDEFLEKAVLIINE